MKTLIVGMGSRDRGDDAVGIVVAQRVAALRPDVDVRIVDATELDILPLLAGYDRLVVVDAMDRGDRAGTTDLISGEGWRDLLREPPGRQPPGGSHSFGLAQALDLAARLHLLPPRVDVHLVQLGSVEQGTGLSPAVQRASEAVVRLVAESLETVDA